VEFDLAFGGLGLEIRGHGANLESHQSTSSFILGRKFVLRKYRRQAVPSERLSQKG
jgi:hypothetical protein